MTRVYRCRAIQVEHWHRFVCEELSIVVYRNPLTGELHPLCQRHYTAETRHEAAVRGWVQVTKAVAA